MPRGAQGVSKHIAERPRRRLDVVGLHLLCVIFQFCYSMFGSFVVFVFAGPRFAHIDIPVQCRFAALKRTLSVQGKCRTELSHGHLTCSGVCASWSAGFRPYLRPEDAPARLVRKIQESVGGGVYTNLEQAVRGI